MNMNVIPDSKIISVAPAEKPPIVSLVKVCKTYVRGNLLALSDVSFEVGHGEFVVILGPSGAGKSTMLRCINRLAEPTGGHIFLRGVEVTDSWRSLFYSFTREDRAIALECLEMVALGHKALQRADTLSGGEQQRVAIARALAQQPKLILADEPVASLDPKIARQVLDYLKDVSQRLGISVICNLHQIDFAKEYAERIIGLSQGKLIFDGPPSALTDDIINQIYGSRAEKAVE